MKTIIKKKMTFSKNDNLIILCNEKTSLDKFITKEESMFFKKTIKEKQEFTVINQYTRLISIIMLKNQKADNIIIEKLRLIGFQLQKHYKKENSVIVLDLANAKNETLAILEGFSLSNYQFKKYKSEALQNNLKNIYVISEINKKEINEVKNIVNSVFNTRDLVNEPFSHLKAIDLANRAKKIGEQSGFKTTIFKKNKIEKLNMGGLLAVNKGSIDGPTFSIMEWKPKNKKNKKPIVLVGKGIVYDTGGLSLKPTKNSMDIMKVDMGGAGVVIGAMQAISTNNLDKHVIGLIPATDNRPSGNAYAPGDVIKMHNGSTVEVLNTDAEGRLILADALSYAKKYDPKLVIDLATLTGAAAAAIGHFGIVSMHKNAFKEHEFLKFSGQKVHERLAEMPFWDDYDKLIESDIADIKNLGGSFAGAITAGKFLSHFTSYPWIHLDIAGPTFVKSEYGYRGKGATGTGVRLLYEFIKNI